MVVRATAFLIVFLAFGCSSQLPLVPASSATLRLAFGSCVDLPESALWSIVQGRAPDMLLLLGDNIYLRPEDFGQLSRISARYSALLETRDFKSMKSALPVRATIDDHDFGPDDSDSTFPEGKASLEAFRQAWNENPKPPPGLEDTLAWEETLNGIRILVPDSRSKRQNASQILFGDKQLEWLEKALGETQTRMVILATSTPWFASVSNKPGEPAEGLINYPKEYQRIEAALAGAEMPVVILSGDRHRGMMFVHSYPRQEVFEFSASPITAPVAEEESAIFEPLQFGASLFENHIGWLEIDLLAQDPEISVSFITPDGRVAREFRSSLKLRAKR